MLNDLTRRGIGRLALGALAAPAIMRSARGEAALKIRCSLDTAPSHPRNQGVVDYLKKVEAASGGKITSEVFHSGQLFPDIHVAKALMQGQAEMAVPGLWVLTGIDPNTDFIQLPLFYGQPAEVTHQATDGKPGQFVAAQLQKKLHTHIIGAWMDLGFQNWYSTKTPLTGPDSFKGLKIRSPGGAAISWRIRFFGGVPNVTPWPNVPLALSQGTFDALVSTDESLNTAKLWDSGVRYSFADHQFMGQYVPMITDTFWGKLSPAEQTMMTDLWAQNIGGYRKHAMELQVHGRAVLQQHGISFTDPSPAEIAKLRKAMIAQQDGMIREANLSPELVKLVEEAIGSNA